MNTFKRQLLLAIAHTLQQWANALLSLTEASKSNCNLEVGSVGGPPAHWVARVQSAAPHLLDPDLLNFTVKGPQSINRVDLISETDPNSPILKTSIDQPLNLAPDQRSHSRYSHNHDQFSYSLLQKRRPPLHDSVPPPVTTTQWEPSEYSEPNGQDDLTQQTHSYRPPPPIFQSPAYSHEYNQILAAAVPTVSPQTQFQQQEQQSLIQQESNLDRTSSENLPLITQLDHSTPPIAIKLIPPPVGSNRSHQVRSSQSYSEVIPHAKDTQMPQRDRPILPDSLPKQVAIQDSYNQQTMPYPVHQVQAIRSTAVKTTLRSQQSGLSVSRQSLEPELSTHDPKTEQPDLNEVCLVNYHPFVTPEVSLESMWPSLPVTTDSDPATFWPTFWHAQDHQQILDQEQRGQRWNE